jgi:hypothetical protein
MTEWRVIPGYEGFYEASDEGQVRSVNAHPKGRTPALHVMTPQLHSNGYLNLGLFRDHQRHVIGVHRLVALAFLGEPAPDQEVAHADGDRANNAPSNLSWKTHRENEADKVVHGTRRTGWYNTVCVRGHDYSDVYIWHGRRECRECRRERAQERMSRGSD